MIVLESESEAKITVLSNIVIEVIDLWKKDTLVVFSFFFPPEWKREQKRKLS